MSIFSGFFICSDFRPKRYYFVQFIKIATLSFPFVLGFITHTNNDIMMMMHGAAAAPSSTRRSTSKVQQWHQTSGHWRQRISN